MATEKSLDDSSIIGIRICGVASNGRGQVVRTINFPRSSHYSLSSLRETSTLSSGVSSILPGRTFAFLSRQGWEIDRSIEGYIKVLEVLNDDNTVNICVCGDKPLLGIKIHWETGVHIGTSIGGHSGEVKGFVYCDFSNTIANFIEEIRAQLPDLYEAISKFKFVFLDQNGWPISKKQEDSLTVVEVCISSCVTICLLQRTSARKGEITHEKKLLQETQNVSTTDISISYPLPLSEPRIPSWKGASYTSTEDNPTSFEVLLSYVHTEADTYARLLKGALEVMGYSVFLDIHCIKGGEDWQDVLNDAITNCSLFVPLITTKYGQTLWTNREVKLADVLGKLILPVNFNEMWPPKCLAIQFATTQYIPGNKYLADLAVTPDSFTEDVASKLAGEVVGKYKKDASCNLSNQLESTSPLSLLQTNLSGMSSTSSSESLSAATICKKSKIKSYASNLPKSVSKDFRVSAHESKEGTPLVVISCCSEQGELARTLAIHIKERGYDVWCSCDIANQGNEQLSMEFQEKANEAGTVVFLLSIEFAEDTFCEQQVYYCEQRKRIIPLIYEPFEMPDWMATLIGSNTFIDYQSVNYLSTLLERIGIFLNPSRAKLESKRLLQQEMELASLCIDATQKLPKGKHVYVCGGSKFFSKNGKAICREVGRALAKDESIILVTGGFFGVGETVGRSFFEEREHMQAPHGVCHIVAIRDDQDQSSLTRQNPDRTFTKVPYGDTLFYGSSVRQREMLTARVVDLCVLIEGGPGAAFVVQQYVWNGNLVVPVGATGGAASGMFNVPASIFDCPAKVSKSDWSVLSDSTASPMEVGVAVCRIVEVLKKEQSSNKTTSIHEKNI